jgi:hypothetical protein
MADCGQRDAVIHPRLQQDQLGLRQAGLGIEHKEVGLCAQFEFALLRGESFLRKIERRGTRGQRIAGLFELMHGVAHLARDLLLHLSSATEIASPRHQRIAQRGLPAAIAHRKRKRQRPTIARIAEAEELAHGRAKPSRRHKCPGGQVILISAQSAALVKALQRKIGFQLIVRQPDAGLVIGQLILDGVEFRPLAERLCQRRVRVDALQLSRGFRLLRQVQFHCV